jgi:hypothetical protein
MPVRVSADNAQVFRNTALGAYACGKPEAIRIGAALRREFATEPREGHQACRAAVRLDTWPADGAPHSRASERALRGISATPHNEESPPAAISAQWAPDAEKGLRKIPFFLHGKTRRNTERYVQVHSVPVIPVETLYDAKAHFGH